MTLDSFLTLIEYYDIIMKIQRIAFNQDLTIGIVNGFIVVVCKPKETVSNWYFVNTLFISSFVFVAAGVYITIVSSSPCNFRIVFHVHIMNLTKAYLQASLTVTGENQLQTSPIFTQ